ncbi:MAG: helix-turn-helix domain-containing protein [Acidimicrobiia bacterium]
MQRRHVLSRLRTGLLIREARRDAGLTQAELATRVGTTQSAVSAWERGKETPRVDTLARILRACGFEADLVLRGRDDEDRSLIAMHLGLSPGARLDALEGMLEFEELAHNATPAPAHG